MEARKPRLPDRLARPRLPRGAWIYPLAFVCAFWAHGGSREEGRLAWLRENPPAFATWRTLLESRGFVAVEDPGWREKAQVEMPDFARKRGFASVSEDRYTIAIRADGEWLYFALGGARDGSGGGEVVRRDLWESLGLGWEAVARFAALELPILRDSEARPPKRREWRDPRGLQY